MASQADQRRLTADEFLRIIFAPDMRMELDDGIVRMMTGGNRAHARVHRNLLSWFRSALRGSGCEAFGPDMAVRTGARSVRYPDIVVDCAPSPPDDQSLELLQPRVVVEVLSPSTRDGDKTVKTQEYCRLATVDTIVLIDPIPEVVHIFQRRDDGVWPDIMRIEPADLALPSLGMTVPRAEVFARD